MQMVQIRKEELSGVLEAIELPLIPVMASMEHFGIAVDREELLNMGVMLKEGIESRNEEFVCKIEGLSLSALMLQGITTSIDALSVGFTISDYNYFEALLACLLIGAVTFLICFCGLHIGKKAGTKLAGKAGILGGSILIFIGLEIFITNLF